MATDFTKVSLGFAEFVSQLIHETFDAILDSQSYQLDKYLELEKALNTPANLYFENYLSREELFDFEKILLNFVPAKGLSLTQENLKTIEGIIDPSSLPKALKDRNLTEFGSDFLTNFCIEKLVATKKTTPRTLLNRPELTRLVIDSGEIKARLELFCLNESLVPTEADEAINSQSSEDLHKKSDDEKLAGKVVSKSAKLKESPKISDQMTKLDSELETKISRSNFEIKILEPSSSGNVRVSELLDKQTQLKTILIDRESLSKLKATSSAVLPSVRLIANPLSSTTTTALSSEITIRFRGIS